MTTLLQPLRLPDQVHCPVVDSSFDERVADLGRSAET